MASRSPPQPHPTVSLSRRQVLAAAAGGALAPAGWAQSKRPLRLVVAGPAGGTADIIARLVAEPMAKALGQPAIVEPKPGAAGGIAIADMVQAPPDGQTLLVGVNSLVSEIPHIVRLRFDTAKELRPLVELARGGLVLVGSPSVPAKNLAELLAWVKANPGKVNVASYSAGTLSHLLGLQLNEAAGIDLTHVSYKGSTPALTDVMGGHVPLMFDGIGTALPLIRSGKIKAFAVSTAQRSKVLPDVPTFAELGHPSLTAPGWMGLWCSPRVPAATQAHLRDAALAALREPAVRDRLLELGFEVPAARGSDELMKGLMADHERVGRMLKAINFQPE